MARSGDRLKDNILLVGPRHQGVSIDERAAEVRSIPLDDSEDDALDKQGDAPRQYADQPLPPVEAGRGVVLLVDLHEADIVLGVDLELLPAAVPRIDVDVEDSHIRLGVHKQLERLLRRVDERRHGRDPRVMI